MEQQSKYRVYAYGTPERRHVSCDYLCALMNVGAREQLIRALAHDIPTETVFEDVRLNKITAEDGAKILMYKRESLSPTIRFLKQVWNMLRSLL